jgi:hypothetical protein
MGMESSGKDERGFRIRAEGLLDAIRDGKPTKFVRQHVTSANVIPKGAGVGSTVTLRPVATDVHDPEFADTTYATRGKAPSDVVEATVLLFPSGTRTARYSDGRRNDGEEITGGRFEIVGVEKVITGDRAASKYDYDKQSYHYWPTTYYTLRQTHVFDRRTGEYVPVVGLTASASAVVFACLSKVCAPPPVGKGGSIKTTGGTVPVHRMVDGRVTLASVGRVDKGTTPDGLKGLRVEDSTELVFGTSDLSALEGQARNTKVMANRAVASNLAKDKEFSSWVENYSSRNIAAANLDGMPTALTIAEADIIGLRSALKEIVSKRDPYISGSARHFATINEIGDAMRQVLGDSSITNSEALALIVVRPMIDAWAGSATTNESVFSQIAAAAVHKAPITAYKKAFAGDFASAKESMKYGYTHEQWVHDALVRAEYAATQQWFADRGIKSLVLYRGMRDVRGDLKAGDEVKVTANPLSSWTTTRSMAEQFAVLDGTSRLSEVSDNLVIAMEVPVSAIQSIPLTGRGCLVETEVVVIGKPATALVTDTSDTLAALIKQTNADTMNGMVNSGLSS